MKQKLTLQCIKFSILILMMFFYSCGVDHTDFSGDWIDKKSEKDRMTINKNGDNYIVENNGKKYPAQLINGLLEISSELPIKATIDEQDNLIISGQEYIRIEKSEYLKYIGTWVTEDCLDCDELIISEDSDKKSFIVSYGDEAFYPIDVEQSNFLNIIRVNYSSKKIRAREEYGNTDFNYKQWYYIQLYLENDGNSLIYKCTDNDNPWPNRTYTKQ